MCVFLFLIIIIIVIYFFCEFPQKNSGMNGEHSEKNGTRWKEWSGKKNSWLKKIEWRRAIFDLDYPFWQLSKSSEHIRRKKKCCLKPTFKCIFHIRCAQIKQSNIWVFQCYLDNNKEWTKNRRKKNNLATHRNRNQKNVFIEDCTFVAVLLLLNSSFHSPKLRCSILSILLVRRLLKLRT